MYLIISKKIYIIIYIIIVCLLAIGLFLILTGRNKSSSVVITSPPSSTRTAPKDGMIQMYIPAGEFLMGSANTDIDSVIKEYPNYSRDSFKDEMPQHKVYLDAYWIDKYEVTNAMFAKFVAETGYKTDAEKLGGGIDLDQGTRAWKMVKGANWKHPHGPTTNIVELDNHPVVQISQNDALAYCQWAGRRLPTEAEWEKAARGMDGRAYPWGNQPPAGNLLNYADSNIYIALADLDENDGYQFTAPVGSFPDGASPYGVMDMAGNVWERVSDWYSVKYYSNSKKRNPTGPSSGTNIIMRGGSWSSVPIKLIRSASRYRYFTENRSSGQGFRCASSVSTDLDPLSPVKQMHKRAASMSDAVITDFDAAHTLIDKDTDKYLIFGNITVPAPSKNLSPTLAAFLGRWEGYSYAPPVKKDWKYILVIQEISKKGGKAYLWCGTNLQYPNWIKKINFRVLNSKIPSIEWDYDDNVIKKTFTFTCKAGKSLSGWQKVSFTNESIGPIELEHTQSFYVYKDYARYLATKRIYPKWHRNKIFPSFYGQGYLLYLPEGYENNPNRSWPLIFFLHGSGDRGDNILLLAKASPFMMICDKGSLPFIIVAPLLSNSEFLWTFPDEYMTGVLEEIMEDYRIDPKRIYVTGLSMGGEATYRFALKIPDRFAAIAPLSAFISSQEVDDMGKIKNLPVWTIHGNEDTIIPLNVGRKPVDALKQAGGNILFSILKDHDHDVWTDTYSDPRFYEWLLQHKKP